MFYIKKLQFKLLKKALIHIGNLKKQRTNLAKNYVYKNKKIDIINTEKTITQLSKVIPILIHTIEKKGNIYTIAPNYTDKKKEISLSKKYKQNFLLTKWHNGLLTNYKKLYNLNNSLIIKRYPTIVFLLTNTNQTQDYITNEVAKLQSILTIQLLDTNTKLNRIVYTIPSNRKAKTTKNFYIQLIKQIILHAYSKESLNLIKDFSRLDSNQRPRT